MVHGLPQCEWHQKHLFPCCSTSCCACTPQRLQAPSGVSLTLRGAAARCEAEPKFLMHGEVEPS